MAWPFAQRMACGSASIFLNLRVCVCLARAQSKSPCCLYWLGRERNLVSVCHICMCEWVFFFSRFQFVVFFKSGYFVNTILLLGIFKQGICLLLCVCVCVRENQQSIEQYPVVSIEILSMYLTQFHQSLINTWLKNFTRNELRKLSFVHAATIWTQTIWSVASRWLKRWQWKSWDFS